jgi:hypothetical protein
VIFQGVDCLLMALLSAMLVLYTVSPLLYRLASSTYCNLSLLSSNFYGLLFGEQKIVYRVPALICNRRATTLRKEEQYMVDLF